MLPSSFNATLWDVRLHAITDEHQMRRTISIVLDIDATGERSGMGEWSGMVDLCADATAKGMTLETNSDQLILELKDVDGSIGDIATLKPVEVSKMVLKAKINKDDEREVIARATLTGPLDEGQVIALTRLLRREVAVTLEAVQASLPGIEAVPVVRRRRRVIDGAEALSA